MAVVGGGLEGEWGMEVCVGVGKRGRGGGRKRLEGLEKMEISNRKK